MIQNNCQEPANRWYFRSSSNAVDQLFTTVKVTAIAGLLAISSVSNVNAQWTVSEEGQQSLENQAEQQVALAETDAETQLEIDNAQATAQQDGKELSDAAGTELIVAKPAAVKKRPKIELAPAKPRRPTPSLDPVVLKNLDDQFQKVQDARKQEDAFSTKLGENYFTYGLLLKDVGRLEEAREMFLDALHITKINEGIYSTEQRPILKALFDTHYFLGDKEAFEANFDRILWLERQDLTLRDDFSFDMALKIGNYYINEYLFNPIAGEASILLLDNARRYLNFALRRYGNAPISEKLMPYGELALVNYLRSNIQNTLDRGRPSFFDAGSQRGRSSRFVQQNAPIDVTAISLNDGERSLKLYLAKARSDKANKQAVHALLGLGDINILFNRPNLARQYYRLAWLEAQGLDDDDPVRLSFNRPVQLPAFNYALDRQPIERKKPSLFIPMQFSVNELGLPGDIVDIPQGDANHEFFSKARRALRKTKFRPVIASSGTVNSGSIEDDIRIFLRNKEAEAIKNKELEDLAAEKK